MVFVSGWQGGRRASGIEDSVRRIAKNTLLARCFRVSGMGSSMTLGLGYDVSNLARKTVLG